MKCDRFVTNSPSLQAVATDKTRVSTYIDQRMKELAEQVAAHQSRSLSNYIEHLVKVDVARAMKEGEIEVSIK